MTGVPLEVAPVGEKRCRCVADHTPEPRELHRHHVWPLSEGGPDVAGNLRWLCPTTHSNVHRLWRAYTAHGGPPSGGVLRLYGAYARELVAGGWRQARHVEEAL